MNEKEEPYRKLLSEYSDIVVAKVAEKVAPKISSLLSSELQDKYEILERDHIIVVNIVDELRRSFFGNLFYTLAEKRYLKKFKNSTGK